MSFIDEAAREINVKVVWYSSVPGQAAALVRYVGDRTRPDLKRQRALSIGDGSIVTHLQFVPAGLGTLRGFSTRFHLYAIECEGAHIETPDARVLLFRGVDGCVFVGGPGECEALARVDAVLAAFPYSDVPVVLARDGAKADAIARGAALGFPAEDCSSCDGTGAFEALKAIAKKMLGALAGNAVTSRPTPAPDTLPLDVAAATSPENTLQAAQAGLDEWQRALHAKAIWIVGYEEGRFTPGDVPPDLPKHTVHVLRPTSSDGRAVITNGFSRTPAGGQRIELRCDVARYDVRIAVTLSFLGRVWFTEQRGEARPWLPFDLVTTAYPPIFGLSHFLLLPGGRVHVDGEIVELLRVVPISKEEHPRVGAHVGEARGAWLSAQPETDRWAFADTGGISPFACST
jgi:hypothetical protein